MTGKDRCGAKCVCLQRDGEIGLEVLSLVTEVEIPEFKRKIVLPDDLSVGEFISFRRLFSEHRGLVILDAQGGYVDEGEVEPFSSSFRFVSDYDFDDDPKPPRLIDSLLGYSMEIKWEVFDQLGARRRFREMKKISQE